MCRRARCSRCCRPWAGRPRSTPRCRLRKIGALERHDIELIGATADAIDKAEDRELFKQAMMAIGLEVPKGITLKGQLRHKKDRPAILYDGSGNPMTELSPESFSKRCGARPGRPARRHPPQLYAWAAPAAASPITARNSSTSSNRRPRRLAHQRSADRGIGAGLEGIRDGGGARQGRQRHHHLLDREYRRHGRAYRRFHHRRPGADPDRQGISAHALGLDRGAARDRGGDRRLQCAVRGQSQGRAHGGDRDESRASRAPRRWPPRPPAFPSPRSPPSWRSATRWTNSRTTSPR